MEHCLIGCGCGMLWCGMVYEELGICHREKLGEKKDKDDKAVEACMGYDHDGKDNNNSAGNGNGNGKLRWRTSTPSLTLPHQLTIEQTINPTIEKICNVCLFVFMYPSMHS